MTLKMVPIAAAEGSVFGVNSFLVHGDTETTIVDAQFEASNATRVADAAEAVGLPVTRILVTHNDPDFYFGTAVLADRFPDAQVVSSPATATLIAANNAGKQAVWGPQLGEQAPSRIVIPTPIEGPFSIDGVEVELIGLDTDPEHTALWIPSQQTVVGGVYLAEGAHLWLADSREAFTRALWVDGLRDLLDRGAQVVYPAHSVTPVPAVGFGPETLQTTIDYLRTVEQALRTGETTDAVVQTITDAYPALPGAESLPMGIGVIRGEIEWETLHAYTAAGSHWTADFGAFAFDLDFTMPGTLTFIGVKGDGMIGLTDTMPYEYRLIGPATFMVSWQENLGARVVHVQDFASGIVNTNIAQPDGSFIRLQGALTPAER